MPTLKAQTTVADNAEYRAECDKLADLEARYRVADGDLRAAVAARQNFDPIDTAAESLLAGGTAVEVVDISRLQRDAEVLRRAMTMQTRAVDAARQAAFMPICAAAKPGHAKLVAELVAAGNRFLAASKAVKEYLSELSSRGDGAALVGGIQIFGIDPVIENNLNHAVQQLSALSADYTKGEK